MDKIAKCFEKAWEDVISKYRKYDGMKGDSPYWYEHDIVAQLMCHLNKHFEKAGLAELEVHANVKLSTRDWKECKILREKENDFKRKLAKWRDEKFLKTGNNRDIHVDILVFDLAKVERKIAPFDLAAEIKFSSFANKRKKTIFNWQGIQYDIFRLGTALELGMCKNAFFCYLDEYHRKDDGLEKKISEEKKHVCDGLEICYSNKRDHFENSRSE